MINDWMDKMGAVNFAAGHHAMQDHFPGSILINGKLYNMPPPLPTLIRLHGLTILYFLDI